jgi:hypothetical protein
VPRFLPKGHFVPKTLLGNIIDCLTFALNFIKMQKKNMDKGAPFNSDENRENNGNIDINTDESLSGTSHLN